MVIRRLPVKLEQSALGDHVARKSCVFCDGAQSWKKYMAKYKSKGIAFRQVAHNRLEFTRQVKRASKSLSSVAGTQTIDRAWKECDRYVPAQLKSRRNEIFWAYVFSWAWRHNVLQTKKSVDWYRQLGQACRSRCL